ncbi:MULTISPECIES: hypothetical protein [Aphanizomenonaceae]|uniref:hypothetical protein n=1 Tax=Aphanizomenonaceae TaxID=1892259 RepID=UPI0004856E6E|nr:MULTISPECIES: hypothetical protein [Aphanizomenonaceae]MBE9260072.1 hypothetical protein [Dolichospermum sp. LEGE 00246]
MTWNSYELDQKAQHLVLKYRDKEVLKESHKMRVTAAYGLERFWGEHLRLMSKKENREDYNKGEFWLATWQELVEIMKKAGIIVPNEKIGHDGKNFKTEDIKKMTALFWDKEQFPIEHQRVTLAVLTQFCDSLVWWTQRFNKVKEEK